MENAGTYNVYRSELSCDNALAMLEPHGTTATPTFSDTSVAEETEYFYAVEALEAGTGCPSQRSCIAGGCERKRALETSRPNHRRKGRTDQSVTPYCSVFSQIRWRLVSQLTQGMGSIPWRAGEPSRLDKAQAVSARNEGRAYRIRDALK